VKKMQRLAAVRTLTTLIFAADASRNDQSRIAGTMRFPSQILISLPESAANSGSLLLIRRSNQ
jgi:hypothetical protein